MELARIEMPNADPEFVRTLAGIVEAGAVGTVRDVVTRACPDWPDLMEIAPELQFKHYTVAEAKLPADALMLITGVSLSDIEFCCDLDRNVFYGAHTPIRSPTRSARATGSSCASGSPPAAPARD